MARVWRGAVAALAVISWLTLANHCALGLAASDSHSGISDPQHDCCTSDVTMQSKPAKQSGNPCCKTLPAVSISAAKAFVGPSHEVLINPFSAAPVLLDLAGAIELRARFLDAGPPQERTFAETVLQRSLRAHAPPCLS